MDEHTARWIEERGLTAFLWSSRRSYDLATRGDKQKGSRKCSKRNGGESGSQKILVRSSDGGRISDGSSRYQCLQAPDGAYFPGIKPEIVIFITVFILLRQSTVPSHLL